MHHQPVNPCRVSSSPSFSLSSSISSSLLSLSFSFVLSSLSLSSSLLSLSSFSSLSLSIFLCLLSLSPCGVVCHVVLCCVVLCFGVRCGVWCVVCVRSTRPRVYRHHAHMLKRMCAWCRYTQRRVEWTHGREVRRGGEGGEEGNRHQPRFLSVKQVNV